MKTAALYARVSGEQQRDSNTIASQTEALIAYAERHGYRVAPDMIIEDDGYSGAVLERPGLERVRDLATEGRIDTVLVHAPDRLSRRYAYQVLIIEELARQGVETVFVNAPSMETPEDHLLVQFQGMIAEYERAQILERSRRGKRHRARRGEIAVLGGAPYGYRYHKKTPDSDAFYEIVEPHASVVRDVYRYYTCEHMSIGAITRKLNERAVPTSTGRSRWERSTVWAMLRNPAYKGKACFGKTRQMPRDCVTRPVRLRGGVASATTGGHEKPREGGSRSRCRRSSAKRPSPWPKSCWNRTRSARMVSAPYQDTQRGPGTGLVRQMRLRAVAHVGPDECPQDLLLSLPRVPLLAPSQRTGVTDSRPVRQDLLDDVVWSEVVRLLEDPALIDAELDRRLEAARASDPNQQRESDLRHRLIRVRKSIDRLVNAYHGVDHNRRAARQNARTPSSGAGSASRTAIRRRSCEGSGDLSPARRDADRLSGAAAFVRRNLGHCRTAAYRPAPREGGVGAKKKSPFAIQSRSRVFAKRRSGPVPAKPDTDSTEGGSYLLRSGRRLAVAQQHLHASLHTGLEGVGLRPAFRGGNRQLCR